MCSSTQYGQAELCALGTAELQKLFRSGELSPVEPVEAVLDRIERYNPELNAYLTVMDHSARAAARAAEMQIASGIDLGPLHGVPVSVKDIMSVKGTRTTAASRVLEDAPVDQEDAEVVRRLRAAGAVIIGKTNLYEFASGDPDPDGPFPRVQNPRRIGHHSGGSSSGSGAAVAAGLCVLSLGTDSGGSIRTPASLCGVVGLKPTHGLVSLRGVVPLSPFMDTVGPMARSVKDVATGLAAIAGFDPGDPCSILAPTGDYLGAIDRPINRWRCGLPTNPYYRIEDPSVSKGLDRARGILVELGLAPIELELPRVEEAADLNVLIMSVEAWLYHERHLARIHLYGQDFIKRYQSGREVPATEYAKAKSAQSEMRRLWLQLFHRVDLLVLPANIIGAPPYTQLTTEFRGRQVPVRPANSAYYRAANLIGFPALTLPAGATDDGLPIGIQLVGAPFSEARLLSVGHALEQALGSLTEKWGIEPRRPSS